MNEPVNEAFLVSRPIRAAVAGSCFVGGMVYAAALPPWNWGFAAMFSLLPLLWAARAYPWKFRLLCGWVWGLGWTLFAYRFLREIHPAIPFLLAPVLSAWPAVYALTLGWFVRRLEREFPDWRGELLCALAAAALFAVVEWTRCRLFVWNDFSVTMWRYPAVMQFAALTGRYGVSFLLALGGAGLFALRGKKAGLPAFAVAVALWAAAVTYGVVKLHRPAEFREPVKFRAALLQGNMPQMRQSTAEEAMLAIRTYAGLARAMKEKAPDAIFFPECAVPLPLRGSHPLAAEYREALADLVGVPLVIGTLDYAADGSGGMTNGALLFDRNGRLIGKYDKFHRVPYGEYVPMRSILPEFMIRAFDMGRDLTAGAEIRPLALSPDVRIGCAICYEGVFSYLTAEFARGGANVLAALSNDVWYPESSEPEQHLANAVMRCVETGLPMIRCGNNGGSGVVTPQGRFTQYVGTPAPRPELFHEQAAGVVEVTLEKHPEPTFFVRFGNWFVTLCGLFLAVLAAWRPGRKRP